MLVTSFEFIAQHVGDITPAQIGRCHKAEGPNSAAIFYQVENAAGARNQEGALIEYQVKYEEGTGYTCTCKSGQEAFKNVRKHPSKVCWHVRAAVACELELRGYKEALAAKQADHLTSHATGTRAALELDESGNEVSDAQYRNIVLAPTKESKRPFPPHWLERR